MSSNYAKDAFDSWAATYDEDARVRTHYIAPVKVAESVARHSAKMSVTKVVDLGTGTGLLIPHLQSHFATANITAVDQSSEMLAEYRKKGLGGDVVCFDLNEEKWPLEPEAAQVAVSSGVMEFIRDAGSFARNIGKLLQDDGLAVVTFEKQQLSVKGMASALRVYPRKSDEVAAQFLEAGFRIAEQSEFVAYQYMGQPITYGLLAVRKHDCV